MKQNVKRRITGPDAPALGPVLTVSSTELTLTLDRAATGPTTIARYEIERYNGSAWVQIASGLNIFSAANEYPDTGLLPSTTYQYRCRAVDTTNRVSDWSTASGTTAAGASNQAPVWNTTVSLTIAKGSSQSVAGYCTDPDGDPVSFVKVGTTPNEVQISPSGLITVGTAATVGVKSLTVDASDGSLTSRKVVSVTVIEPVAASTFGLDTDATYYVAGSATNGWRSSADTVEGWDWSFPSNTTVAPLSGIFMFVRTAFPEPMTGKRIYKINADWWQMEETEGDYSGIGTVFAPLDEILTTGEYDGLPYDGVQIDVRGIVYSVGGSTSASGTVPANVTAPDWLAAYMPNTAAYRTSGVPSGQSQTYVFFNFAHQEWYSRFRLLIDQIANYTMPSGYKIPAHPMLTGQIVHGGGTASQGEEEGFGWDGYANTSIAEAAKTVRRWAGRYRQTGDTDSDGISGYQTEDCRRKLEWVGQQGGSNQAWVETRAIIESGMGSRGGLMERWIEGRKTPRNSFVLVGQALEAYKNSSGVVQDRNYYFINDPTDPRITELRWFGDQNEEFDEVLAASSTSSKGWAKVPKKWQLNYRMATLSTLARKLNNTAMEPKDTSIHGTSPTVPGQDNGCEGFVNPSIIRWLSVQLGKRPYSASEDADYETNEAWCCLCRMEMKGGYYDPIAPSGFNGATYANSVSSASNSAQGKSGIALLHNFERWLTQRETDGATVPVLPVTYGYNPSGNDTALDANCDGMDQGRTGDPIGFRLDDAMRFGTAYGSGQIAVKVTFFDNNVNTWTLRYSTASGLKSLATSPTHDNEGGDVVRTATFFISDFVNTSNAVNFQIEGGGITPFMFVRVIRV